MNLYLNKFIRIFQAEPCRIYSRALCCLVPSLPSSAKYVYLCGKRGLWFLKTLKIKDIIWQFSMHLCSRDFLKWLFMVIDLSLFFPPSLFCQWLDLSTSLQRGYIQVGGLRLEQSVIFTVSLSVTTIWATQWKLSSPHSPGPLPAPAEGHGTGAEMERSIWWGDVVQVKELKKGGRERDKGLSSWYPTVALGKHMLNVIQSQGCHTRDLTNNLLVPASTTLMFSQQHVDQWQPDIHEYIRRKGLRVSFEEPSMYRKKRKPLARTAHL